MAESLTYEIRDLSPPGEILAEALEERGMTHAELARRGGLSEKHVSQLVNARVPLSTEVALRLEQVLGIPANLWLNLETGYRSELKRRERRARLEDFAGWMRGFPIPAMRKAGYFEPTDPGRDVTSRVDALLRFFGVTSPETWQREWAHVTGRFRKSPRFDPDLHALTAWLRRSEVVAQSIRCAPFDRTRFRRMLQEARCLTTTTPTEFVPQLVDLCARTGVALTFVPSLPGLAVSGVTRWLGPTRAAVSLSLRHKSDDQLWFSFFHEACHVLEHKTAAIYIDAPNLPTTDPDERRADEFARDLLIAPQDMRAFLAHGRPTLAAIKTIARRIGVSPGIVVGRLQHDGVIPRSRGNHLKRWLKWEFE